jgi:hypothetical protein
MPTDGLELPTQKKQWIEILDCISDPERWVTRAMLEGTVGCEYHRAEYPVISLS